MSNRAGIWEGEDEGIRTSGCAISSGSFMELVLVLSLGVVDDEIRKSIVSVGAFSHCIVGGVSFCDVGSSFNSTAGSSPLWHGDGRGSEFGSRIGVTAELFPFGDNWGCVCCS